MTILRRACDRLRRALAPKPCERCGAAGCLVFLYTGVRVTEGPGGTSIGVRVSALTPPAEWLCRACVPVAMADPRRRGLTRPTRSPSA